MTLSTFWLRRLLQAFSLALMLGISCGSHASEGEKPQVLPSVDNAKWQSQCTGCHMLYHPALLPERSWRKIMSGLDHHFGKSVKLDAATQQEITEFLATHAAEHSKSSRAKRIAKATQAGQIPLRIEETAYFNLHHNEIGAEVWQRPAVGSKANCKACHPGAEQDNFDEKTIKVPR